MFRTFLLILFLSGLTAFSVVLEYKKTSAAPSDCPPVRVCVPAVLPPACPRADCEVERPSLRRWCAPSLRVHLRETVRSRPQLPCLLFREDPLQSVARVSTADILRAISR